MGYSRPNSSLYDATKYTIPQDIYDGPPSSEEGSVSHTPQPANTQHAQASVHNSY